MSYFSIRMNATSSNLRFKPIPGDPAVPSKHSSPRTAQVCIVLVKVLRNHTITYQYQDYSGKLRISESNTILQAHVGAIPPQDVIVSHILVCSCLFHCVISQNSRAFALVKPAHLAATHIEAPIHSKLQNRRDPCRFMQIGFRDMVLKCAKPLISLT